MARKFDLRLELAGLLTAALAYRNDTGVYAWAIARELGLTIEDEEAAVLAQLRKALAAPAFRVKITVTGDCGHVLWTGFDRVDEKYPFGCSECEEDKRTGKYPWKLATEIVAAEPEARPGCTCDVPSAGFGVCPVHGKPRRSDVPGCACGHISADHHHDSVSGKRTYCNACAAGTCRQYTAEPEPGEACPIYRPGENGFRWQCMLGMAHNNPDQDLDYDDQQTVHRDQFGTEFRVARCRVPAEHGRSRCWCAIPEHHKPLESGPPSAWVPLAEGACGDGADEGLACGMPVGPDGRHRGRHEREAVTGGVARWPNKNEAPPPDDLAPVYLLACGCQESDGTTAIPGQAWVCTEHGDTTVTMAIPLPAATA